MRIKMPGMDSSPLITSVLTTRRISHIMVCIVASIAVTVIHLLIICCLHNNAMHENSSALAIYYTLTLGVKSLTVPYGIPIVLGQFFVILRIDDCHLAFC